MPYVIEHREVPHSVMRKDRLTNAIFLTLNLMFPVITGIAYCFADSKLDTTGSKNLINNSLMTTKCGVVILQVISAGYLGVAINKIRKFVGKKEQSAYEIDVCQLTTHLLAFGLYLVSSLVMLIFLADSINNGKNGQPVYLSLSVS